MELNVAVAIVVDYLDCVLYRPRGRSLLDDTLTQYPARAFGRAQAGAS
jgi:hypothetical protein